MVVLLGDPPISTEELWSSIRLTIGFLVTSLIKALLPHCSDLPGGQFLEESWWFYLRMMEATVFFGTFSATEIFWYPSPYLCLDTFLISELYRQIPQPLGLVFALTCSVNCGTLYR
jgi:hypothetical protein